MLWPAGWKLQKLGGHSCAAFESKIEVLKSWPSGGWSDHASAPKPLILQEFKQIARGIACVRHPDGQARVATIFVVRTALAAGLSGCFSLRLTDNLQDTTRFIRAGFTRKKSGGDGDHLDRCLHCYVDPIAAVGHLEDGRGVLGVLVRIVGHAATACASNSLQTTQT